jgi:hypothetical protein
MRCCIGARSTRLCVRCQSSSLSRDFMTSRARLR